jgi:N-acetylglucosamine kinase-like BadF-type ATPase
MLFAVDAGGMVTTAVVEDGDGGRTQRTFPSLSASAVGEVGARATMGELFGWIAAQHKAAGWYGWIGHAAIGVTNLAEETATLVEEAERAGIGGLLGVSDDVAPLLLAPPLNGVGFALVAGTGSILIGQNEAGEVVQVGGYEWVISDEGSGFAVGRRGLRAAERAFCRTGPDTDLLGLARDHYGAEIPALGDLLARLPFPKQRVAGFAKPVCTAAEQGDAVAAAIVHKSAGELAAMLRTAVSLLPGPSKAVAGGSLPARSRLYASTLRAEIAGSRLPVELTILDRTTSCALALAGNLRAHGRLPQGGGSVPHRIRTLAGGLTPGAGG